MSDMRHSPSLFIEEDCVQMKFNIRSCKNTHKLRAMIEHGGGLVQGTVGEDIIQLRERGCKVLNVTEKETVLSVQYIFDCVEKNKRLDMNKYILKLEPSTISDISSHSDGNNSSDSENNSDGDAHRNSKKYPKVSFYDDKRIIHFLLTNSEKFINKSKKFMYQQAMQENIVNCSKKTFDRHLNYIYCNISIFDLSRSEENLLSEILLIKTKYSYKDDLKIIDCILRNKFYRKECNRKLFRKIAKYCDFDKPAKSVIKHFNYLIRPNLDRYGLSDHDMRLMMGFKKKARNNANTESVHSCDNSNNEGSSSEHDFVNVPLPGKKSKHSKPRSIKTHPDNSNIYYKPLSINDLHHQREANAIQKTNCVKSDFMSKPRFCKNVAKKRQHFETHRSAGFSSDIDEFSSDEEIDQTYKRKKSSPLSRNRERTTSPNFTKPSGSSDKHDMVQNHMVNGTKKCTTSSKQDFKEAVGNSNVNISKKITSTLQEIAATFNLVNEDTAVRDCVFSHNLNQAPASGNGLNKEVIVKNEPEQAAEENITRCSDSTQVRMQQGLKFFDLEKCSLSFPDTLEDMVLEDDSPLLSQPHVKPASSDQHMVKDIYKEKPTELMSSLEPETILLVLAEKSEQPISSDHSDISQSIMPNSNAWVSDDRRDLIGRENLKDSNKPEANLQANGIQQNNEVEDDDDIEDIQIAETPEEILRPTPLLVPETQTPGESEIVEVADEKPSALPERRFFTEIISILKRIEEVIVKIDGNYDLKNDLQNTVNELFSLIYQQRFKCSIRSIMKKNKLSITDKALLLKYIAYTRCEKPQDLVHKLRS